MSQRHRANLPKDVSHRTSRRIARFLRPFDRPLENRDFHNHRQDLAPDTARAVGDDWFVFEMVELAALKFLNKFGCRFDIWNHSIFKSSDTRLKFIASIKEHEFITTLIDKRVELMGVR